MSKFDGEAEKEDASAMSVADVRKDFGDVLNRAHYRDEVVSIAKRERPFAIVASNREGENLLRMREMAGRLNMDTTELVGLFHEAIADDQLRAALLGRKKK
jgi:hypothetical protein